MTVLHCLNDDYQNSELMFQKYTSETEPAVFMSITKNGTRFPLWVSC